MSKRVNIVGNMTGAPELKFGQSGKSWATFTVATNEGKDDNKRSSFTRCKVFGDMAEHVSESLDRGMRVIVQGREFTEEWEANGEKRSANVLIVDGIGPDLRWATARVARNERNATTPPPPGDDPWAADAQAKSGQEPPF